jgi:hypothetical protein
VKNAKLEENRPTAWLVGPGGRVVADSLNKTETDASRNNQIFDSFMSAKEMSSQSSFQYNAFTIDLTWQLPFANQISIIQFPQASN